MKYSFVQFQINRACSCADYTGARSREIGGTLLLAEALVATVSIFFGY